MLEFISIKIGGCVPDQLAELGVLRSGTLHARFCEEAFTDFESLSGGGSIEKGFGGEGVRHGAFSNGDHGLWSSPAYAQNAPSVTRQEARYLSRELSAGLEGFLCLFTNLANKALYSLSAIFRAWALNARSTSIS
jgi:hypothetical protein